VSRPRFKPKTSRISRTVLPLGLPLVTAFHVFCWLFIGAFYNFYSSVKSYCAYIRGILQLCFETAQKKLKLFILLKSFTASFFQSKEGLSPGTPLESSYLLLPRITQPSINLNTFFPNFFASLSFSGPLTFLPGCACNITYQFHESFIP
jgi:hypothetical protein